MTELAALIKQEHDSIQQSRKKRLPPAEPNSVVDPASLKAICLSGGGVRSATFATGVFNSWAKDNGAILRKFDYLSTVSGGGYFGAFYGRLFQRHEKSNKSIDQVYRDLADDHSAPSKYLKRNSRYLANSKDEAFVAAAVILRNIIWLHGMLLMALIPLMSFTHMLYRAHPFNHLNLLTNILLVFVTLFLLLTPIHFITSLFSKGKWVRRIASWMGLLLRIIVVVALLLIVTVLATYLVEAQISNNWYLSLSAFLAAIYKWYPTIQQFIGKTPSLKITSYVVATVIFVAYLTMVSYLTYILFDWLYYDMRLKFECLDLYNGFPSRKHEAWILLICAPAIIALVLNKITHSVNQTSLHYFYAARLRRAFLGAANSNRFSTTNNKIHNAAEYERGDDVRDVQNYRPELNGGPLHLINTTLNNSMSPGNDLWWPDCKGQNLAVSGLGYNWSHSHHSAWNEERPALSLGQWIAVSGAAASTGMGQSTTGATSLMAALFNIRTGLWWHRKSKHVFYSGFWTELSNRYRSEVINDWYLSDGGHFENLGIYEMVRRRIPRIVAIDAGCDSEFLFEDLGNLIRRVQLDFRCKLEVADSTKIASIFSSTESQNQFGQLDQLKSAKPDPIWHQNPSPVKRAVLLHGKFETQDLISQIDEIWILYIKPTLTRQEPIDVLRYQIDHPDFPHQSTNDQFFDEAQWESYRKLGEITANDLEVAVSKFLNH